MKMMLCGCALLASAAILGVAPATAVAAAPAAGPPASPAAIGAAAVPPCYGAAARDLARRCTPPPRNVFPPIDNLELGTSYPCVPFNEPNPIACTFGASGRNARRDIALVGDSHALQWRVALDMVARRLRWRGFSITAPGCPFSAAVERLPEGLREQCVAWYEQVQAWFRDHPEVKTVFVSQFAPLGVVVEPGQTQAAVKVAGFKRAWRRLPKTVKQIVVIRDNPLNTEEAFECAKQAIAAQPDASAGACALRRSSALRWDMAVSAAKSLRSRRYRHVDLTHYFCDRRTCPPVIGGVLVYRDPFGHITNAYSGSLAPFLLRKVRRLARAW